MKPSFRAIGLLASSLMLVILSGCTTQISGLKVDPSFTYPAAISGHIAIVGVVSSVAPLAAADAATYSNQLKTQLSEKRPDFILISYGEVINQLGPEDHTKLLKELQTMGTPSNSSMDMLRKKTSGYRYIVFSRIESDSIQKTLLQGTGADGKPNNTVRPETSHQVTGSLQVVDITDGKIVWSATAETLLRNVSLFPYAIETPPAKTPSFNLKKAAKETLVEAVIGNPADKIETEYTYPAEPSLMKALEDLFGGFSKNMPNK